MAKTKRTGTDIRYIKRGAGIVSGVRIPVFTEEDGVLKPVYELQPNGQPKVYIEDGMAYPIQAYAFVKFKPFQKELVEGTPVAYCCYDVDATTPRGVRDGLATKHASGELETLEEWESRRNPDKKVVYDLQKENAEVKDELEETRKEKLTLQQKIAELEAKAKSQK